MNVPEQRIQARLGAQKMEQARRPAQIVNRAMFVAVELQMHVNESGSFPASLTELVNEGFPAKMIEPTSVEKIAYYPPAPTAPTNSVIYEVKYYGKTFILTKGFERTITP